MKSDALLIDVQVVSVVQATPKIKVFQLSLGEEQFTFRPGQWIDLYAPVEGKNIGGYTITSSPKNHGYIELAIRESATHPVTQYLHNVVKPGDFLKISQGQGKFFLPEDFQNFPITFIAGGIGITPLLSMIRSLNINVAPFKLFYSVSNEEDILFKDELSPFTTFTVTRNHTSSWHGETSRIDINFLKKHQCDFNSQFFICGPRPLIDDLSKELHDFGVPKSRIHFEKWW